MKFSRDQNNKLNSKDLCSSELCRTGECEQFKNNFMCHCDQVNIHFMDSNLITLHILCLKKG